MTPVVYFGSTFSEVHFRKSIFRKSIFGSPFSEIHFQKSISEVHFSEVHFPEVRSSSLEYLTSRAAK